MKIIKVEELCKIVNPTPGQPHRPEIRLDGDGFKNLGGMFGLLAPKTQVPYHYHKNRESILIPLSGEAVEIIDGKETAIKPGDVLVIPAGEKHTTVNRSAHSEFRFLEFFTCPPMASDFVKVE
jgi:quercetin dioxygenase-like cupin family protein